MLNRVDERGKFMYFLCVIFVRFFQNIYAKRDLLTLGMGTAMALIGRCGSFTSQTEIVLIETMLLLL